MVFTNHVNAAPEQVNPIFFSGFESGEMALVPNFSVVQQGAISSLTSPTPLALKLFAPATGDTFFPIVSSEPGRLTVVNGGVTVLSGQSSAAVQVNALVAGAAPVILTAGPGGKAAAGIRVEKALNESDVSAEADFCTLQAPPVFSITQSTQTPTIFGQLFETGVTEAPGSPAAWIASAGYGPSGTDPRSLTGWTFFTAAYNIQSGNNDEFQAVMDGPSAAGNYSYVFRFSSDNGASWTYCDLDGAGSNVSLTFSPAQQGLMGVYDSSALNESDLPAEADFCNLQFPASFSVAQNATTTAIFGRLYEAGITDPGGAAPGWIAQAGFGKLGSDPRVPGTWSFFAASYNTQDGNNDEYSAVMTAPGTIGTYSYVFRFSQDSGVKWTYCDLDGAGSNSNQSFSPGILGTMTVTP